MRPKGKKTPTQKGQLGKTQTSYGQKAGRGTAALKGNANKRRK